MYDNAVLKYQQVQAATATPGEILLALYDGLFRFLRGAKLCFENKEPGRARELLSKSHAILSELTIALDYAQDPVLCGQLDSIYSFCTGHLMQANMKADPSLIDEILRVLTPLKEAWAIAVPEAARELASASSRPAR